MCKIIYFLMVCLFFVSCKKETKKEPFDQLNCIEIILKKDSELGTIRNHACEKMSLSKTIDNYVASLQKLDYTECSTEFTQAFLEHQKAWLAVKIVTDSHTELRGEMHDLFDAINKTTDSTNFKVLVKDIWVTWEDVEKASK